MKLVMPLSQKDFRHASLLAARFKQFADMQRHSILVTACWSDRQDIPAFIDQFLHPLFAHANYAILPDPYEGVVGTAAANHMFYQSVLRLSEPFCLFEADCFPVRAGWLDELQKSYELSGKPYAGAFNNTYNNAGEVVGRHLVGGAATIYPADLLTRIPELEFLYDR